MQWKQLPNAFYGNALFDYPIISSRKKNRPRHGRNTAQHDLNMATQEPDSGLIHMMWHRPRYKII